MFDKAYVTKDVEEVVDIKNEFCADTTCVDLNSHGSDLLSVMYMPQGKGSHPTAILLHGFPGYDDPIDIAQALRRCGMNVLRIHYRGSWGVCGTFSFANCMEDVKAAIDYVTREDIVELFNIDTNNLFLIGHSMGGFMTLTCCVDDRIKAAIAIAPYDFGLVGKVSNIDKEEKKEAFEMYKTCTKPLNNTNAEILMQECLDNGDKWNLPDKAEALSNKKILIIASETDSVSKKYLHHDILSSEIKKYNKGNFTEIITKTDHSYSNKRVWVCKKITEYLDKIINN